MICRLFMVRPPWIQGDPNPGLGVQGYLFLKLFPADITENIGEQSCNDPLDIPNMPL